MELKTSVCQLSKPKTTFYTKFYSFVAPTLFNTTTEYIKHYKNSKIFCTLVRRCFDYTTCLIIILT